MMNFFKKHFWAILLLFIFVSYGQILKMSSWQDDNAIFFKLEHINEPAGFFGRGLIGEGPYRFSFSPYWFIYKLFGNTSFLPYYIFIFILYFLASFAIYKFFSKFISKKAGVIAGILFACGFIASDGFMWLANALVADVSIILLSLCLFFYYKFSLKKNIFPYLLSLALFWATAYFTPIRSYYFIGIIVFFELIFLTFKNKLKSILFSILRLIPFLGIFYNFFIYGGDARSGLVKGLIQSILTGKFYILYGFLSSIANTIVPDNLTAKFFTWQISMTKLTTMGLPYVILVTLLISIASFYFLFRKIKRGKLLFLLFSILTLIWVFSEYSIFNVPIVNLNENSSYTILLGGILFLFLLAIYFVISPKFKNKYLFFIISFLISIAAYWAYEPLVVLYTTHRYLVGAFSILVGLLGLIYTTSNKKVKFLIIIWGFLNLLNSVSYQNTIITNRTIPVNNFYKELKADLPNIEKGSLLYFDLANSTAGDHFNSAISTASMPNETSIAWRYGIDRYDFQIVTYFNNLIDLIKTKSISLSNIHTFYYSGSSLVDTTNTSRSLLANGSPSKSIDFMTDSSNGNGSIVSFKNAIPSVTPIEFDLSISAIPPDISKISFPYTKDQSFFSNSVAVDPAKRNLAFAYQRAKSNIIKNSKVTASSSWQKDFPENAIDGNTETNWRSHRILWGQEKTYLMLDMGSEFMIDKFVWINGYGNSTPTKYSLEISSDSNNWIKVDSVIDTKRIDIKDPQIISFPVSKIRYLKMNLEETLDNDSPQIAEIWAIPSGFDDLDVSDAEKFLANPFGYIPDSASFKNTLINLENQGEVRLLNGSKNKILYDGLTHTYSFSMMPGGTEISRLVLNNLEIPGNLSLENINYRYLGIKDIEVK